MKELKEKTFTDGCEDAPQGREINESYNPNREVDDATWRRLTTSNYYGN